MIRVLPLLLVLLPVAAHAQQAPEADIMATTPTLQTDLPTDPAPDADPGRDVNNDPTSLTGRGGPAVQTNRTFQATIGTAIYTPIGTPIGTRMGVPH